jgi:hypothetical protein
MHLTRRTGFLSVPWRSRDLKLTMAENFKKAAIDSPPNPVHPAAEVTPMRRLVASRLPFLICLTLVIAVIDHGQAQNACPGPSGFTRIARDLGRRFCTAECEDETRAMAR